MLSFYKEKYSQYNEVNVLKSLIYFEDIDFYHWPEMAVEHELKWKEIKNKLEATVKNYLNKKL